MSDLDPRHSKDVARQILAFTNEAKFRDADWQSQLPWPHRRDMAKALDYLVELGAMVLNLSERLERELEAHKAPQRPKLGFAAAVRNYGDNWRQSGFCWNGESYRGLAPDTICALGETHTADYGDYIHMKNCCLSGRIFQV